MESRDKRFKRPLKVLHVTPHYEPAFEMGGVVRSVSQLCRGLVNLGQDVTVFTTSNNRLGKGLNVPVNQEVDVCGVKCWYFQTNLFNTKFFYSRILAKACYSRVKSFDILHITSLWCHAGIPSGKAARLNSIPYIMSTRGTLVPYCLENGWLKKRLFMSLFDRGNLEGASAIHYTTEMERAQTHQYNKLKNPSFVIPNAVPIAELTNIPDKAKARRHFSLPFRANVVSYVGRLHKRKAIDILIQSFVNFLPQLKNNCYLLIAGPDDGEEAYLRQLVAKKGVTEKVRFLGYVDSKERGFVLKAADLFWYATHPGENFGHSVIEALVAGVPVILSEYVGVSKEILEDGAGIIVSHNPKEIAKKVVDLISDKERQKRMSANAKQSALKYDTDKVAPLMLKAYEDVLTGKRSAELRWK